MMNLRYPFLLLLCGLTTVAFGQSATITGALRNAEAAPVAYANVILHAQADSSIVKVETSDDDGVFRLRNLPAGRYFLVAAYVGLPDVRREGITLTDGQQLDLDVLPFGAMAVELAAATVTARRSLVEVKPDRTVFNVEGTINSVGSNGLDLLRQAPAVTVDNNDNISVLSRSGVLVYVDGKRLPLTGDDLANYLRNLPAEQIDRFDIITNPGARYEAQGNAGIIDIRLKKDKSLGANGSVSLNGSQGEFARYGANANANYRNKKLNLFGTLGYNGGEGFNEMTFLSFQNGLVLDEVNRGESDWNTYSARVGTDFFLGKNHTVGFLIDANSGLRLNDSQDEIQISRADTPARIDSTLNAPTGFRNDFDNATFNLNYQFNPGSGRSLNVDADYGRYRKAATSNQRNEYTDPEGRLLTTFPNSFDTPTDIDIYTFKVDYEQEALGGQLGVGTKLSRVVTENTFLFFEGIDPATRFLITGRSNDFDYTENVYAGYLSYARKLNDQWNLQLGLRAEQTDATGDLRAYDPTQAEPPVALNYLSWFPNAGLTYQLNPTNVLSLNYGRRINRPDYNVLNPFVNQLSQLSFERGNPFLRPEIVNNVELGYTLAYRYNFKLGYSRTDDQITRLIGPDADDERASFISWDNLANQTVISANVSAPIQVTEKWNAFLNLSGGYTDNQADYGNGAVVDVQAWTYNIYTQNTITLPKGFTGEISGYFAGPGVWGGVFEYDESWALNLGLQKQFLQKRLNAKLSANDIFFQSGWQGRSEFDGLVSFGAGNWDSRRVALSLSYRFGNDQVKSRKRKTGLEAEGKRVK